MLRFAGGSGEITTPMVEVLAFGEAMTLAEKGGVKCEVALDGILNRDSQNGPIPTPAAASTEQTVPSVSPSTPPNTSTAVISATLANCAPRLSRGWSLRPLRSEAPLLDCHSLFVAFTPRARDHVGCHASRSMRLTICRNRRCVKWLSAS